MNAFVVVNVLCIFGAGCVYSIPTMVASSVQQSQSESYSAASEASYSASSSSSSSSSTVSSAAGCSPINVATYQSAFSLAKISQTESDLYMNCLNKLSATEIAYFDDLISLYNTQDFALADSVSDFVAFQNEMSSIYNTLNTASIYAASADWATQTQIYNQVQANLANALQYTTQGSCLHNLLNFANTDLTYIPLVAGTCYHLANLQNQFYSASSSTSTTVSSSGLSSTCTKSTASSSTCGTASPAFDTTTYQTAFGLAKISQTESDLYMNYLNKLSGPQITYFNDLISLYNTQDFALADTVTDFVAFQNEMSSIYNTLNTASLYAASADWATQTQIYNQVQANLANALQYTAQGSCLHNLLNFANTDLTYIPLVAGTCYHLANLQNQFYSASSSTSTTVSSSGLSSTCTKSTASSSTCSTASSAIDTATYQTAFGLAKISQTESDLYINYLNKLSGPQITYFNDLISLYNTQDFALADTVTDFVAFQNEMSSIYNTLNTASIYAASADWATQTQIYNQVQANLANALQYTAQGSCLHNLLSFANTDLTYIPLVAGTCYHLANLQNQYFAASASSSSASYQETATYESTASSSSMSAVSQSCAGSAVTVC